MLSFIYSFVTVFSEGKTIIIINNNSNNKLRWEVYVKRKVKIN